jgi:hypothetical protein
MPRVGVRSKCDPLSTPARSVTCSATMSRTVIIAATLEHQWKVALERERALKEEYNRYLASDLFLRL